VHTAHPSSHLPDEAFAAKYLPDLNYDVKEFQVFHWKLSSWKGLEKKLTSPEFDCGGYKWYVLSGHCHLSPPCNLKTHPGIYFSSRSAIPTFLKMTMSPYIFIVQPQRVRKRIGTLASNLR